jgi:glucuronokinase
MIIQTKVHARAGLLGNPSDMYRGKVISFLIKDFSACVRLRESPKLTFRLHPEHDRAEFADLPDFVTSVAQHGYYGMQRVLFATCRRFADYCQERGITLRKANFTLEYETDIPRQFGMGGSSAMVIAALRALLRFHRISARRVPRAALAELALSVETQELGIAAGLQDRVVQSYGGLTYMDFSGKSPHYQRLNSRWLPGFGLAYPSEERIGSLESGRVHAPLRLRWEQGDREVRRVMAAIARCAEEGREVLRRHDGERLGRLMDRNFDLRRSLYGDTGPERSNIRLVEIARELGFSAKLPGSGGAALVLLEGRGSPHALAEAYAAQGYHYLTIKAA